MPVWMATPAVQMVAEPAAARRNAPPLAAPMTAPQQLADGYPRGHAHHVCSTSASPIGRAGALIEDADRSDARFSGLAPEDELQLVVSVDLVVEVRRDFGDDSSESGHALVEFSVQLSSPRIVPVVRVLVLQRVSGFGPPEEASRSRTAFVASNPI